MVKIEIGMMMLSETGSNTGKKAKKKKKKAKKVEVASSDSEEVKLLLHKKAATFTNVISISGWTQRICVKKYRFARRGFHK